jgi:hypothetical protein
MLILHELTRERIFLMLVEVKIFNRSLLLQDRDGIWILQELHPGYSVVILFTYYIYDFILHFYSAIGIGHFDCSGCMRRDSWKQYFQFLKDPRWVLGIEVPQLHDRVQTLNYLL